MTKLTQSMVLEASRAACVALTDEDLAVMVRSLNRQLGQQAAAHGVEQIELVARAMRATLIPGSATISAEYVVSAELIHRLASSAIAALAVAPPPVGRVTKEMISAAKYLVRLDDGYETWDRCQRMADAINAALSTLPVRGGK